MRVESSKIFKNIKNSSKFQKSPKSFPKVSKRVLNMFWVNFFQNFFCPVFHEGRIFENFQKNQKLFKIAKKPKINPKIVQTCFEYVLGYLFRNFFAQCFMECRVFENFQKNEKLFKIEKKAQNRSQKCPNVF